MQNNDSSNNDKAGHQQAATLNLAQYKDDWKGALDHKRPFYLERPAMFSSAAAAQDAGNRSRMLWCWAPIYLPWEYTSWLEEARSFHDTAYIGDWSGIVKLKFTGRQAHEFLSYIGTNDLSNLEVGFAKHHVQTSEQGKVASQGLLYRTGEEEYIYTGNSAFWSSYMLQDGKWDVQSELISAEFFVFSVQGPLSKQILEKVAGESIELRFNYSKVVSIAGVDVRVVRTGITGELGYELHGSCEFGNQVWAAVVAGGEEFGIKQLGVRSQIISHVEAGIATNDRDFVSAAVGTPGAPLIPPTARSKITGSYPVDDLSTLFRTPAELGWYRQLSLDTHDFIGRDALLAERAQGGPAKKLIGLKWDSKGVVDVYATLFGDQPLVPPMELPRYLGLSVDKVLVGGEAVGCSTSRVFSPFLRQMISLGYVPEEFARPGTQVTVLWGDHGGPQREIAATVVDLPFKEDVRRVG